MPKLLKYLTLLAPLGLAAGAVAFFGAALFGSSDLPAHARGLINPPAADAVAPAPEGLSSAIITRDWQEVGTSPSEPKPPKDPDKDDKKPKPPKPAK